MRGKPGPGALATGSTCDSRKERSPYPPDTQIVFNQGNEIRSVKVNVGCSVRDVCSGTGEKREEVNRPLKDLLLLYR